ncbi:hypothetical protein MRX96_021057 [Rhipicephalus microplus]
MPDALSECQWRQQQKPLHGYAQSRSRERLLLSLFLQYLLHFLFPHLFPLKSHRPSTQSKRNSFSCFLIVVSRLTSVSASVLISEAAMTWPSLTRMNKWDCISLLPSLLFAVS